MPTGSRHLHHRLRDALTSLLGRACEPRPAVGEAEAEQLLRCPVCRDASICPLDWERDGELAWWIRCRCGNCGVWVEAVVSNQQAAALDCALDGQVELIRRAAHELGSERKEHLRAEAAAFMAALQRDRNHPADFESGPRGSRELQPRRQKSTSATARARRVAGRGVAAAVDARKRA